jgi:hypothetical protein
MVMKRTSRAPCRAFQFEAHQTALRAALRRALSLNSRTVDHPSLTFWPLFNSAPNPEFEEVGDGCAVIQDLPTETQEQVCSNLGYDGCNLGRGLRLILLDCPKPLLELLHLSCHGR